MVLALQPGRVVHRGKNGTRIGQGQGLFTMTISLAEETRFQQKIIHEEQFNESVMDSGGYEKIQRESSWWIECYRGRDLPCVLILRSDGAGKQTKV